MKIILLCHSVAGTVLRPKTYERSGQTRISESEQGCQLGWNRELMTSVNLPFGHSNTSTNKGNGAVFLKDKNQKFFFSISESASSFANSSTYLPSAQPFGHSLRKLESDRELCLWSSFHTFIYVSLSDKHCKLFFPPNTNTLRTISKSKNIYLRHRL